MKIGAESGLLFADIYTPEETNALECKSSIVIVDKNMLRTGRH